MNPKRKLREALSVTSVWKKYLKKSDTMARKPVVFIMHNFFFPTEQHFSLSKAGFVCLFTVNTCHIATEILLNNNTYNVKLLGLEAFNEKTHMFLIKNNK